MATLQDILATPTSGYNYIDALLASGPDWNFITTNGSTFRTTLYYSFATEGTQYETRGIQTFNTIQQQAARDILAYVAQITGINFAETSSAAAADLHFAVADIADPTLGGVCYAPFAYKANTTGQLTSYSAGAYIYLDSLQTASQAPVAGTWGYQELLHEIGHALGLKHPFEATSDAPTTLQAPYVDTTAHTVMSYTQTSTTYYSQFNEYDLAALNFLYGTDGLRGTWGVDTSGCYLTGSSLDSSLTLPSGQVTLTDMGGVDTVHYAGAEDDYTIVPTRDKMWLHVSGATTDHLISSSVEYLSFADGTETAQTLLNPRGGVIIGSAADDLLTGTPGNDLLFASSGNDRLSGGGGDDMFIGGDGLDTAIFDEKASNAVISRVDDHWMLNDNYGDSNLSSIERLQFSDCKVALDLSPDQSGGMAALVTSAAGGTSLLSNQALMGQIIGLFDSGEDLQQVCEVITEADWFTEITGGTAAGFVDRVYEHVAGIAPTAAEHNLYLGMLSGYGGNMSQADLLAVAALTQTNQDAINLVSLQQTGLVYL